MGYDYDTMNYDIAVVIVNGTMPCSKGKIWPACLPSKKKYAYEGWADTMVSGWGGINSTDSTESNTLKYVKVPIVSDAACAATEPEYGFYPDTMNCAGKFITQCTFYVDHILCDQGWLLAARVCAMEI